MSKIPDKTFDTVYIVEDESVTAMDLSECLAELGYQVSGTATSGETALQELREKPADVVLMDIKLSGRADGIETADQLQMQRDVPVVFLTAFADDGLISRAAKTRQFGYLMKPFDQRELHATLQTVLSRHRVERGQRAAREQLEDLVRRWTAEFTASQRRIEHLLKEVPAVVYLCQPHDDFGITFVSENVAGLLGHKAAEFLENPGLWFERIHPEDNARFHRAFESLIENNRHTDEYRFQHCDGGCRWIRHELHLARDPDGRPNQIIGRCSDVTELRKIEARLEKTRAKLGELNDLLERSVRERTAAIAESERFAQAALDALDAHVAILNESGVIIATNQAWRNFAKENNGRIETVGEGADYLAVCDRGETNYGQEAFADGIRAVMRGDRDSFSLEYHCPGNPSGRSRWFLGRVARFPGEGPVRVVVAHHDVTPLKQVHDQLEESRVTFHSLARVAPTGIFQTDRKGKCTFVNEKWRELSGLSEKEALGSGWERALHPEDRERVVREWNEAARNSELFCSEYRFQRPDGHVHWVHGQASRLRTEGEEPAGYIGTVFDITSSKQTEAALRALSGDLVALTGEEFFTAAIGRLADLTECEIAFSGKCDPANPEEINLLAMIMDGQFQTLFSYPVRGTPCERVVQGEKALVFHDVCREFSEDRWLEDNGIDCYVALPLMDAAGRPIGLIGVMSRDSPPDTDRIVSLLGLFAMSVAAELERQRSERQFRGLFESAPDAILITDSEGVIRLVNAQAEAMFGWPRDDLCGQPIENLVPASARRKHVTLRQKFHDNEVRTMGAGRSDLSALRRDGSEFPAEISLSPIETDSGMMVAAAVRDISERVSTQKRAQRQHRMESLGQLAGGIAHDLNNALAPILSSIELLRLDYPDEDEILETVERSAKRGAEMVRQLLTFAKGVEGARALVNVGELVRENDRIAKGTFPKNIQVNLSLEHEPFTVLGDETQLHQVLLNLCVNARDAMADGGCLSIEVTEVEIDAAFVSAEPEARAGRYVVVRVRDTGVGIAPEIIDRVFEPFFSTKEPDQGTGLGLSTVMGIVRAHHGFTRISSVPRQGTAVSVYLPCAPSDQAPSPPTEAETAPVRGNGETVLVVDDEPDIRQIYGKILESLNFHVITAKDGIQGLAKVAEHSEELRIIITDLQMPDMNGLGFVRVLRRMLPHTAVIVASGKLDEQQEREFRELGVGTLLDKPFTQHTLTEAVRKSLTA